MLNTKLKHHLAGLHAVSHEVSTYIYIDITRIFIQFFTHTYFHIYFQTHIFNF